MKAQPALRGQRKVLAKTTAVPIDRVHEARPSGTGKSHLVEALAHAAIEKDLRVAWFTLETPTAAIARAEVARAEVGGSVARTRRSDLIVIDDISMLPAGQDAAEAFYRITNAVYEHRSAAVSSNLHPDSAVISWTVPEFLDPLRATAKLPTLRQKLRWFLTSRRK